MVEEAAVMFFYSLRNCPMSPLHVRNPAPTPQTIFFLLCR